MKRTFLATALTIAAISASTPSAFATSLYLTSGTAVSRSGVNCTMYGESHGTPDSVPTRQRITTNGSIQCWGGTQAPQDIYGTVTWWPDEPYSLADPYANNTIHYALYPNELHFARGDCWLFVYNCYFDPGSMTALPLEPGKTTMSYVIKLKSSGPLADEWTSWPPGCYPSRYNQYRLTCPSSAAGFSGAMRSS